MPKGNPAWKKGVHTHGQGRPAMGERKMSARAMFALHPDELVRAHELSINIALVCRNALRERIAEVERIIGLAEWKAEARGEMRT